MQCNISNELRYENQENSKISLTQNRIIPIILLEGVTQFKQ